MIRRAGLTESASGWGLAGLTEAQLDEIHRATLDVLENCGVVVESEEALDLMAVGGCRVDRAEKRVRIPARLVEDAIRSAPERVLLAGRDPAHDVVLEDGRVGFTVFGVGLRVLDIYTGEHRGSTLEDLAQATRLADALTSVDIGFQAVDAGDLPEDSVKGLIEAETIFANTSKHFQFGDLYGGSALARLLEMAAAVVGGEDELRERPVVSSGGCPTSPLQLGEGLCEIIKGCANAGVPALVLSMAMAGATGPVTLAGTLVTHNAEVLSGLVLHQLVSPGAPFIYGSSTTVMDMTYATAPVGCPELGMIGAAATAMARYYLLPSFMAGG
jgi:trimethylamine---corrinoid protein Co-methyltransferase